LKRAGSLAALVAGGCVYLNSLYNAGAAWDRGEAARLSARPDSARVAYAAALSGAAESFRRDSLGPWALPALLLAGKAQLRLGNPDRAVPLLERVAAGSTDSAQVGEANLYLGAARWLAGDPDGAMAGLNLALFELSDDRLRGEAHLWRGRVLLARGLTDQGFWDLARAGEAESRLRVPAAMERIRYAVQAGTPAQAGQGLAVVVGQSSAGVWSDSISVLMERAGERWGPGVAAELLLAGGRSRWLPEHRTPLMLQRARFLREAGRPAEARAVLEEAIRAGGPLAPEARLAAARLVAATAGTLEELEPIQRLLAPELRVDELERFHGAAVRLRLLAGSTPESFPGRFAAAELARDELEAPRLAAHLFLEAAGSGDAGPWAGKAWLAATALSGRGVGGIAEHDSPPGLRGALIRARDPYLARARNRYLPTDTLAVLDRALQIRLDSALAWAAEAQRRRSTEPGAPGTR
jgi:tetratricopeptide (TPR) repeat protein